ncbi:senecionine N-oxygenase isoform X2 [Drosophila busckii]|uniref:senecionine N-oxygenase isoform X2 n=1 Tax=Drosophila busckii TaxID=30019 RepID=UPI00083EF755|nr:senecionine N-oxygenase isoform X2 [Drosophila busckii]
MTLCIIGAGTAGLCCGKRALEHYINPTIFELSNDIGGTWVFNKNTGILNGIDVHSSMYKSLRTNLPKEVMGYPDFEIGDHDESYLPAEEIHAFLSRYADHFGLRKYIEFNTYVIRVLKIRKKWQILVKNLITNQVKFHYFDKILIANGHYHTPNYIKISNCDRFKGELIHSHDYRSCEIFQASMLEFTLKTTLSKCFISSVLIYETRQWP